MDPLCGRVSGVHAEINDCETRDVVARRSWDSRSGPSSSWTCPSVSSAVLRRLYGRRTAMGSSPPCAPEAAGHSEIGSGSVAASEAPRRRCLARRRGHADSHLNFGQRPHILLGTFSAIFRSVPRLGRPLSFCFSRQSEARRSEWRVGCRSRPGDPTDRGVPADCVDATGGQDGGGHRQRGAIPHCAEERLWPTTRLCGRTPDGR